jgi:hypothetical protein
MLLHRWVYERTLTSMKALPHHTLGTSATLQNVVIDLSSFQQMEANGGDFPMQSLIDWVRSYPRTGSVHVYLPTDRTLRHARQLQSTLLSLGCTVTRKLSMCHT